MLSIGSIVFYKDSLLTEQPELECLSLLLQPQLNQYALDQTYGSTWPLWQSVASVLKKDVKHRSSYLGTLRVWSPHDHLHMIISDHCWAVAYIEDNTNGCLSTRNFGCQTSKTICDIEDYPGLNNDR